MKLSAAILAVAIALLSFGCGGDEDDATATGAKGPRLPAVSDGDDPRFATVTVKGREEPEVVPPDLTPPRKLLVRDIEEGSGPIALPGDRVTIRYLGVMYESGDVQFIGWKFPPTYVYRLGTNANGPGFEEGVLGMREGGLREMIIPSRLAFGTGAIDYVVDLVRLEPAPKQRPGG